MKKCSRCNEIKSIEHFYKSKVSKDKLNCWCKECLKKYYRETEKAKEYRKSYYEKNIEKIKKYRQIYCINNANKVKECIYNWNNNNKDRVRKNWSNYKTKTMLIPKNRISKSVSVVMRKTLKGNKNNNHWENIIGYTLQDLMQHLEKQFKDGMSWDNQGDWHIDHIIPISLWQYETHADREFKQCWALANLQPLWAIDNIKKGNKMLHNINL